MNKELENAFNELIRIKKILLVQCKEDVKNIIENKVTATNYIESTLDKLLDFFDDEDFMELCKLIANLFCKNISALFFCKFHGYLLECLQ